MHGPFRLGLCHPFIMGKLRARNGLFLNFTVPRLRCGRRSCLPASGREGQASAGRFGARGFTVSVFEPKRPETVTSSLGPACGDPNCLRLPLPSWSSRGPGLQSPSCREPTHRLQLPLSIRPEERHALPSELENPFAPSPDIQAASPGSWIVIPRPTQDLLPPVFSPRASPIPQTVTGILCPQTPRPPSG